MKIAQIMNTTILVGGLTLSAFNPSHASLTDSKKTKEAILEIEKQYGPDLAFYLKGDARIRHYGNIARNELRNKVENICKYYCNHLTCKDIDTSNKCSDLCPGNDIRKCEKAE